MTVIASRSTLMLHSHILIPPVSHKHGQSLLPDVSRLLGSGAQEDEMLHNDTAQHSCRPDQARPGQSCVCGVQADLG